MTFAKTGFVPRARLAIPRTPTTPMRPRVQRVDFIMRELHVFARDIAEALLGHEETVRLEVESDRAAMIAVIRRIHSDDVLDVLDDNALAVRFVEVVKANHNVLALACHVFQERNAMRYAAKANA